MDGKDRRLVVSLRNQCPLRWCRTIAYSPRPGLVPTRILSGPAIDGRATKTLHREPVSKVVPLFHVRIVYPALDDLHQPPGDMDQGILLPQRHERPWPPQSSGGQARFPPIDAPPSAKSVCPVMKPASSGRRNSIAAALSSGWPNRPIATPDKDRLSLPLPSGLFARNSSVSVGPSAMALPVALGLHGLQRFAQRPN